MRIAATRTLAVLAAAGIVLLAQAEAASAQQMGRQPWQFKVLNSPLALNRAIGIEQKEDGGFNSRVNTFATTNTITSTAAENFTQVLTDCGNDASCAVDATVNREGTGGEQGSSTGGIN